MKTALLTQQEACEMMARRLAKPRMDAEKILDVLERQTFYDWYEKEFAEYIQDIDENLSRAEHKEKVLAKIRELFGVD